MQKDGEEWAGGLDPISNPSAAEMVHKKVTERTGVVANAKRSALEAAYGGADAGAGAGDKSAPSDSGSLKSSESKSGDSTKTA